MERELKGPRVVGYGMGEKRDFTGRRFSEILAIFLSSGTSPLFGQRLERANDLSHIGQISPSPSPCVHTLRSSYPSLEAQLLASRPKS